MGAPHTQIAQGPAEWGSGPALYACRGKGVSGQQTDGWTDKTHPKDGSAEKGGFSHDRCIILKFYFLSESIEMIM